MASISLRRATAVVASAAALTLGLGGAASAHECYKVNWSPAAYQQHMKGNNPWTPLSDVFEMHVVPDAYPECAGWGDRAAELFMDATNRTQEPLIHMRATIGTGQKAHPQGKQPPSIDYLDNYGELLDEIVYQVGVECGA